MVAMSSRTVDAPHLLGSPDDDRPAPVAGCPLRLSILGWAQAGSLAALVGALVVLPSETTPHKEGTTAWAMPTRNPAGVRALALAPDGRRLATGGADGAVVLWEVGQGVEKELREHPSCWVLSI